MRNLFILVNLMRKNNFDFRYWQMIENEKLMDNNNQVL